MESILVFSGAAIFLFNYVIGWLLKLNVITMTRQLHQVIFSVLLLNLTCLLFYVNFREVNSFLLITSLFFLLIMPFGKKGGTYHIIVSTIGIITYVFFLIFELNFLPALVSNY